MRDSIYAQKASFEKRLQEGKSKLKATPPRKKRETTSTPLEKAVMSRKPSLEPSDNEDDLSEQDWRETEGSGIADEAEKLINQLELCLGSIKAGNNSIKLKKQVFSLLDSLVELGTIDKKQNFFKLYTPIMSFDILLDSSLAKQERGGERNVSHDFTVKFYPPI